MNARVTTKVTIRASPEHVFKFLSHLQYHPLWNPPLEKVIPKRGELHSGSQYISVSTLFGMTMQANNTVSLLVPSKAICIENTTGTLHELDGQTVVQCKTMISADSKAFAFAKPILSKLARAELQADLRALKKLAEQKPE